jgi:hypothetical protein
VSVEQFNRPTTLRPKHFLLSGLRPIIGDFIGRYHESSQASKAGIQNRKGYEMGYGFSQLGVIRPVASATRSGILSLVAPYHRQNGLTGVRRHAQAPLPGTMLKALVITGRQVKPNAFDLPTRFDVCHLGFARIGRR